MSVELAVRTDDPGFGGTDLAPDTERRADAAQRTPPCVGGLHDVEIDRAGGVAAPGRQPGLYRTAQREIQQDRVPAAMYRTQPVVVLVETL